MNFDYTIEITRQCFTKCAHCLRGAAQKKCMSVELFVNAVNKYDIQNITLTGGEPLINLDVLRECTYMSFSSLWFTTSGIIRGNKLRETVEIIKELYDNRHLDFSMSISVDEYHSAQNFDFLEELSIMGITAIPYNTTEDRTPLSIGRAYNPDINSVCTEKIYINDVIDVVILHINVEGDVFISCNMSYKMQKHMPELCLGNVATHTLDEITQALLQLIDNEDSILELTEKSFEIWNLDRTVLKRSKYLK